MRHRAACGTFRSWSLPSHLHSSFLANRSWLFNMADLWFAMWTGASALDKRTKQRLQASELQKLGAKRQKGRRIPASIGLGEWREC